MIKINKKLTPYNYTAISNKKNKYIVVHYVGAVSTAKNNVDYYASQKLQASAHYFVDSNSIWQSVEDWNSAWHCGGGLQGSNGHKYHGICKNSNSIGIEMCCFKDAAGRWFFTAETVRNTIELVRYLMDKHNIPIENVIRHYDVTGKICPAPYVNETEWAKFKEAIIGKDELTMTQYEELKDKIAELTKKTIELEEKNKELEKANKIYHYWSELPTYAKEAIKKLYDKGIYKGNGPSDLDLPESLMRSLVINDRAGLYE